MSNLQVSDTTGLSGLFEDVDFLCGSNSVSYPLKDKARNANQYVLKAAIYQIKANKKWQYDDISQTTLPTPTATLVASQSDYSLPTDLLHLEAVEVKDSGGNWIRLTPLDKDDLKRSITDFNNTAGMPRYFDTVGTSIVLYPAPSAAATTLTNGLKVHYSRDPVLIVSTDTTKSLAVASPFHRFVSYGTSYDWLIVNGPEERCTRVRSELEVSKNDLIEFYEDRDQGTKTSIRPVHDTRNYE